MPKAFAVMVGLASELARRGRRDMGLCVLIKRRSLQEVQKRGMWQSHSSVAR